jgi:tetratricopeptide (TPR) repeat protein
MAPSPPAPPDEIDVFISYSQKDRDTAEEVERMLKNLGKKVWRDDRLTERPAENFILQINQAHQKAVRVLVLWSPHSVSSRWVLEEAEAAANARKIVPLTLGHFHEIPVPIGFRNFPTATLAQANASQDFLRRILDPATDLSAQPDLAPPRQRHKPRIDTRHLPQTYTAKLYGRDEELKLLLADWNDPSVRVAAFDAPGGTGKTALITHFIAYLEDRDWHGAESVFVWSFYSQGASEDKQTHAAEFFEAAFEHFHPEGTAAMYHPRDPRTPDEPPKPLDATDMGLKLANAILGSTALLVLDGLEPLQYGAGTFASTAHEAFGGIKDRGVQTLLERLLEAQDGLTVITTRIPLTRLQDHHRFRREELGQLPTADAIELLRDRGIEQDHFPRAAYPELPATVRASFVSAIEGLKNHALSLNLGAHLVAEHYEGRIEAFEDISLLPDDDTLTVSQRSPFKVMETLEAGLYRNLERRLANGDRDVLTSPPATQLCLLYFLGLFDRPASIRLLDKVYPKRNPEAVIRPLPAKAEAYLATCRRIAADQAALDPKADSSRKRKRELQQEFLTASTTFWFGPISTAFDPGAIETHRWNLGQLETQGLVAKARLTTKEGGHVRWEEVKTKEAWEKNHVDCHPLIREYFGLQLSKNYPKEFQAAHGRLYDHFRFEGLPEEFRDPVAYGALALKAAFPDAPHDQVFDLLLSGKAPHELMEKLPPSLARSVGSGGSIESVRSAQSLLKTPAAETALTRFLPTTEAGMTPLFAAIGHGCLAGRHDECFNEVYWPRIARGNEQYAAHKLGLHGQNLAALASFFEVPFRNPQSTLRNSDQALVLNLAGFALRAIGRLPDAVEPFRAAVDAYVRLNDPKQAAINAGNLSELLLTLGQVERDEDGEPGALPTAARAVAFADQSGDLFQRMVARACQHANALLAAGRLREAEERFREAESLQRQRQPTLPRLYSLPGFLYGDLLLARGRAAEVLDRLAEIQRWSENAWWKAILLDDALYLLNAARARARLASSQPSTKNQEPGTTPPFLPALLDANRDDITPLGYLAQAEILLGNADWGLRIADSGKQEIETALHEAETRARRGPMPLFLAEVWLLRSRLLVLGSGLLEARRCWKEAKRLIEKHGYGRRKPDLAVLDCEIDPSLEAFQTACGHVGAEGWWEHMPRLEALVAKQPTGVRWFGGGERKKWDGVLEPLRKAEKAYQAERDAYLKKVEKERQQEFTQVLSTLPQETIQQIATQTGAPADWTQWPDALKAAVVQAVLKSRPGG